MRRPTLSKSPLFGSLAKLGTTKIVPDSFRNEVRRITEETYKNWQSLIDPNHTRGENYHLDHKISISEGYNLGMTPKQLGSLGNLQILTKKANLNKGS